MPNLNEWKGIVYDEYEVMTREENGRMSYQSIKISLLFVKVKITTRDIAVALQKAFRMSETQFLQTILALEIIFTACKAKKFTKAQGAEFVAIMMNAFGGK